MPDAPRTSPRFPLPEGDERPLRILLVEDSDADADLLLMMLEDELPTAVVTVSPTLADAVPLLEGPLDIVITDLSLPDAEGLHALTAILAARPNIAVVVMTGQQDRSMALQALSAGAEDYLVKGSHDAQAVATSVLYAAHRHRADLDTHRYERLALSLLDAMEASTCAVDGDGRVIAVNRAWREFAARNGGLAAGTGVGTDYLSACDQAGGADAEVAHEVAQGLRDVLSRRADRFEREYSCHAPDEQRWLSVRINPLPETGAVLSHVDVSAAKRAEQTLAHLSLHDPLTDLPNRHLLVDRLERSLARTAREGGHVVMAFLDLDQFKRVNDSLGHAAGDELLRIVGRRLEGCLRQGDSLARFAGDEFVVVWSDVVEPADAEQLAARLTDALRAPVVLATTTVTVTASIGVSVGQAPQTAQELLHTADAAMYEAKSQGRGRTCLYTDDLRHGLDTRLRTEAELQAGLQRGEFVLHYQPVVDLQRRAVVGVEALLRWEHPDGLRMPDAFIPVAESTGLIVPLGAWVLEQACRQGAAWAAEGLDLQVAVNLSARQVSHIDVLQTIEDTLHRTGLPASRLLAEVTETTMMEDTALAQVTLRRIAELGVHVAIDDFGTGYSSLLYLKQYPIQALKVDRSFVAGMGVAPDDDAIVASVVNLAKAVGAVCIAEGVETPQQQAALTALGCDYAQGYLFSPPVPAHQLPAAVEACARALAVPPPRRAARPATPQVLVPIEVRDLVTHLMAQGGSLNTIAAALNRAGALSPYGKRWHPTSVAKVIAALGRPAAPVSPRVRGA